MGFLHEDTPITRFLTRLIDLVLLNVLWLVCCLPIVTIGASTSAMYDVLLRLCFREDISVVLSFFKAFAKNFKKATILYLISAFCVLFLLFDFWCSMQLDIAIKMVVQVVILSVSYFALALISYLLPTLAYFNESIGTTIRHAFVLAMRSGIYTVFIMIMNVLPLLLFFFMPQKFFYLGFAWLTIGFAFLAFLNSLHFARIFDGKRLEEIQKREKEEKENEKTGKI